MSTSKITRREALGMAAAGALATAGARAASGQAGEAATALAAAIPPVTDIVTLFQLEEQARLALPEQVFSLIAGGDRDPFEYLTLHPRLGEHTLDMDLSVTIMGETLYTPIIVGPIREQGRFHPEGELATLRGAEAAYTLPVFTSGSSVSIEQIASQARAPFWYSVYAGESEAPARARTAVAAGAKAVIITAGAPNAAVGGSGIPAIDWRAVDAIRQGLSIPVALKGVMTPADATAAVDRGIQAIVVSNHGVPVSAASDQSPLDALPAVAAAVGGRIPVLVDGSFRRGTDAVKALILGAQGVLVGRPIAWGLAAYGAEGVQVALNRIEQELARNFGLLGVSNLAELAPDLLRRHRRATT